VKSALSDVSPLLLEDEVYKFFQCKVKRDPYDPEKKILTDEEITLDYWKGELSSTEKAQKALKFISQFESGLNVMHTLLSMNEERDEIFELIMVNWKEKVEKGKLGSITVNPNLQRGLIDCIVDLSIFPEGRRFFQKMLGYLSEQVKHEVELGDKS